MKPDPRNVEAWRDWWSRERMPKVVDGLKRSAERLATTLTILDPRTGQTVTIVRPR